MKKLTSRTCLRVSALALLLSGSAAAMPRGDEPIVAPPDADTGRRFQSTLVPTQAVQEPQNDEESTQEEPKTMGEKTVDMGKKAGGAVVDTGAGILSLPGRAAKGFASGEFPYLKQGVQEIGVSGNVNFTNDTVYNLDLSYGYFFKDNWESGFTANAFGQDDFNFGIGLFTEYNFTFEESKWVPYLGGAVKWARVSTGAGSDNSAAFSGELGMKYFIRSGVALFSAINFDWSPDDVFGIGDTLKDSAQNLNFGMRFYL